MPESFSTTSRNRDKADPYIVATARYLKASNVTHKSLPVDFDVIYVVSEETTDKQAGKKIPTACKKFDMPHISHIEMLKKEFPDEDWDI